MEDRLRAQMLPGMPCAGAESSPRKRLENRCDVVLSRRDDSSGRLAWMRSSERRDERRALDSLASTRAPAACVHPLRRYLTFNPCSTARAERMTIMTCVDRRTFLGAAGAGLLVLPGRSGRAAASERVRIAVIGLRNRGTDHAQMFAANPGAEVVAVCDVDDAMFAKPVKAVEATDRQGAPGREGLPPAARRQVDRRRHDRHARPLARPHDRHGLPGGQGRLRREAGQPQRRRGPADGRGRPEVQAGRPGRDAEAEHAVRRGRHRPGPRRGRRQGGHGPRLDPSEARQHRPRPARTGSRRASITRCGKAPRPTGRSTPTGSTTTGTGSGTGGPASSATTASTRSTSPAGAWASTRRSPSAPAAASTSSTTIRRSPTRRS